ncbi:hypothetical protein NEOC65_002401 [Neochlamydia sp. AcF65]|nr:hypothetical protein [Neochlamydia sp. AcF65]
MRVKEAFHSLKFSLKAALSCPSLPKQIYKGRMNTPLVIQ